MALPTDTLPPEVMDALRRDRVLEASRLLHERSGVPLRDARRHVERERQRLQAEGQGRPMKSNVAPASRPSSPVGQPTPTTHTAVQAGVPPEVLGAFREGRPLAAIRMLLAGPSSGQARHAGHVAHASAAARPTPLPQAGPSIATRAVDLVQAERLRRARGLAPGEVPHALIADWMIAAAAIGVLLLWLMLGRGE